MPFRPCPSGCGRFLSADDRHDRCLQCLDFQHTEDGIRGWLMRLLWAYEHDFAAISPFLSQRIGTLCCHPRWSFWLEQRTTGWCSGRSEGDSKSLSTGYIPTDLLLLTQWTSRPVPLAFQHIRMIGCRSQHRGMGLRPLDEGAVGLPPLECCHHRPTGPRADSHACPGSCEYQAGGQHTAQSRTLAAGWLVSQSDARLTTAFCSGAFFPRGAWGADEVVDGPFHGQKPLVRLLRPHYPRRRGCQGVHGHSPGGENGRGAPAPTKRHHLEEPSASPVQSL